MSNDISGGGARNVPEERIRELFERVLKDKKPELERIAKTARLDEDECRQEAIFRVFRWLPSLRDKLLSSASDDRIPADQVPEDWISNILFWSLVKTMKRLIIDESRRIGRQKTISIEPGGPDDNGDADAEGSTLVRRAKEVFRDIQWRETQEETKSKQRRQLREAMDELQRKNPVRHQIVSRKLEEVSDQEIARLVGLSEDEVKKEWGLAVKQLRYHLKTNPPGIRP